MKSNNSKNIVEAFWQAFSNSEFDEALSYLDDQDFSWWIAGDKNQFGLAGSRNKAEFSELLYGVAANTENGITMTPTAWTVDGERVAMEAESKAHMTTNGKVYNNFYHFLHIVKDGKITRVKEYLDTIHAADVLCS